VIGDTVARRRKESKERTAARLEQIADHLVGIGDRAAVGQRGIYNLSNIVHRESQRILRASTAEIKREQRSQSAFTNRVLRQMFGDR
jgi:hypothetical protein